MGTTKRHVMLLAAAGVMGSGSFLGTGPIAEAAAARDGNCDPGEFCIYHNSDQQGSVSDFDRSIPDYGTEQPTCWDYKGPGKGRGDCVKNDAASAWNRTGNPVTIYFNSNYGGQRQTFAPGDKTNLDDQLKNDNAAHRLNDDGTRGNGGGSGGGDTDPFTVLSYNIRNPTSLRQEGRGFSWVDRRDEVFDLIRSNDPDVFGLQEVSAVDPDGRGRLPVVDPLPDVNAEFRRDYDSYRPPGYSPKVIFWKKSRFEIADDCGRRKCVGSYTYTRAGAPFESACESPARRLAWVLLRDVDSGQRIFVVNTHFHSNGTTCTAYRAEAAKQIHAQISAHNPSNHPIVLTGDFNNRSEPCSRRGASGRPITIISEASDATVPHVHNLDVAVQSLKDCRGTFNSGWDANRANDGSRIDFIFHSRKLKPLKASIDRRFTLRVPGGRKVSPSDHYPVVARFDVKSR